MAQGRKFKTSKLSATRANKKVLDVCNALGGTSIPVPKGG